MENIQYKIGIVTKFRSTCKEKSNNNGEMAYS